MSVNLQGGGVRDASYLKFFISFFFPQLLYFVIGKIFRVLELIAGGLLKGRKKKKKKAEEMMLVNKCGISGFVAPAHVYSEGA